MGMENFGLRPPDDLYINHAQVFFVTASRDPQLGSCLKLGSNGINEDYDARAVLENKMTSYHDSNSSDQAIDA